MIDRRMSAVQVLDEIDAWAKEAPLGQVVHLTEILSAVRGPDEHNGSMVKKLTTAVIRCAVLPNLCTRAELSVWDGDDPTPDEIAACGEPTLDARRTKARKHLNRAALDMGDDKTMYDVLVARDAPATLDRFWLTDEISAAARGMSAHFRSHVDRGAGAVVMGTEPEGRTTSLADRLIRGGTLG